MAVAAYGGGEKVQDAPPLPGQALCPRVAETGPRAVGQPGQRQPAGGS